MKGEDERWTRGSELTGEGLLRVLSALSNPQRLRIIASLAEGETYTSQLARNVGLSRPLVHMHLNKLSEAGLVRSHLELSQDGKAMRFFEVNPFIITLTPAEIVKAARDLGARGGSPQKEEVK